MTNNFIKSPMNYTGGKYKILEYIIPCFPKEINQFVDLFAGGLNVGINIDANIVYANDQITYLIELYRFFQENDIDYLLYQIGERIKKYNLNSTNKDGYNQLRRDYNNEPNPLDLFILTCYSFNHQIRFNSKHEFNTPFGKERSSFNASIESNLVRFCNTLSLKKIVFTDVDFRKFNFDMISTGDFVYCDPPYLITTGSYNDGKRGFTDWTEQEDMALLHILDNLNARGIKFALSNVFHHKGMTNEKLIEWSKQYYVKYIDKRYSNCNYQFKERDSKTVEVLITNYNVKGEI